MPDSDATWEDYQELREQFPEFVVEDNSLLKRKGISESGARDVSVGGGGTYRGEGRIAAGGLGQGEMSKPSGEMGCQEGSAQITG